jgi:hypothetical protein
VARQTEKPRERKAAAIEMRKELAAKIAVHAQSLGENRTAIPGLALYGVFLVLVQKCANKAN